MAGLAWGAAPLSCRAARGEPCELLGPSPSPVLLRLPQGKHWSEPPNKKALYWRGQRTCEFTRPGLGKGVCSPLPDFCPCTCSQEPREGRRHARGPTGSLGFRALTPLPPGDVPCLALSVRPRVLATDFCECPGGLSSGAGCGVSHPQPQGIGVSAGPATPRKAEGGLEEVSREAGAWV